MNFKVNSTEFEKLLARVVPVVPSKSLVNTTEFVHLSVKKGELTCTATDLEILLRSSMKVEAEKDFEAMLPAKLLYETIRSLEDTLVSFDASSDQQYVMKTDHGQFYISYNTDAEKPFIPEPENEATVSLDAENLLRGFYYTSYAMLNDTLRPAMSGTLLEFSHEGLRFVSTSGHTLVRYIARDAEHGDHGQFIIPYKAVGLIQKAFSTGKVFFTAGSSVVEFKNDDVLVRCRLINERYPDYNSVIPVDNNKILKFDRSRFLPVLKRMLIYANPSFHSVELILKGDNVLEFFTKDPDTGARASEKIYCDYKGDEIELAFNGKYLEEAVSHINDATIIMKIDKPSKACIMVPSTENEKEELLVLIMPIRVHR